jgi:glucose/arabinose dehydrogenase
LPKVFTTAKNGGVKTIFTYNNNEFALISSLKKNCFYASIVSLNNGKELFKTNCLPKKYLDYNGLGSSNVHHNNKIFLSIGTPEQRSSKIRALAQDNNSMFGKILEIKKTDLDKIIAKQKSNLSLEIFTSGHRNPQGLTKIKDFIFSVEHGPRGGDELNKIIKDKNYGWPAVSYGTQYVYDEDGKAYDISHENNQFEEPLFALIPSVGISALNTCPSKLKNYYKKPCLLALSLSGNRTRPGKSILIFLLNEKMNQVHSIEKIFLRDHLRLRHFITNSKNELYEDKDGNIYVSADKVGIYKISFIKFRN